MQFFPIKMTSSDFDKQTALKNDLKSEVQIVANCNFTWPTIHPEIHKM